ncbi:MAG: hypothetical protein CMH81_05540 [Nitrospiraceae bacterium]|nr:hypothetical protein [Nitrospiraceae bacterium]
MNLTMEGPLQHVRQQEGMALVLVLWILMLLTVLAFEFSVMTRTEAKVTLNQRESTEAYYLARAGIYKAIAELSQPVSSEPDDDEEDLTPFNPPPDADPLEAPWMTDGRPYQVTLDNGTAEVRIYDEGGKINLNEANGSTLRELLSTLRLEQSISGIVDPILDWRDPDNNYHRNGAEDTYYLSLPEPYHAKNGPFDTMDELLWVKGITPDIFYGKQPEPGRLGRIGLIDVLTASLDAKPAVVGSSTDDDEEEEEEEESIQFKVNVNTAPPEVLMSIPGISESHTRLIVAEREFFTFLTTEDLDPFVGDIDDASPFISFQPSNTYTIDARGSIASSPGYHHIRAIVSISPKGHRILQWNDSIYAQYQQAPYGS